MPSILPVVFLLGEVGESGSEEVNQG